jgi:hypothetical protein
MAASSDVVYRQAEEIDAAHQAAQILTTLPAHPRLRACV